jgi:hypothetical protein
VTNVVKLCRYVREVVNGPWPEAEHIILRDSKWAPWYRAFTAPRAAKGPALRRQLEKFYALDYALWDDDARRDKFLDDWCQKTGSAVKIWGWENHEVAIIMLRAAVESGMNVKTFVGDVDYIPKRMARLKRLGYEIIAFEYNFDIGEVIYAKWA